MTDLPVEVLLPDIKRWLEEDDLGRNHHYMRTLPTTAVEMRLKFKSDMILAGTDHFTAVFAALGFRHGSFSELRRLEGRTITAGESMQFGGQCPFNIAVTGERLALNLLQHASSIATWTAQHVKLAEGSGVKILDTRKTTPGLRTLEKYAVRVGGGYNHRMGQTDTWMVKDNHKSSMGGMKGALAFFFSQGALYNTTVVEIHDLKELEEAISLGVRHVMLDNFSPENIRKAIALKKEGMTFEVSGGLRLDNMKDYLIEGVDALSMGALTYSAPRVDISLKFRAV